MEISKISLSNGLYLIIISSLAERQLYSMNNLILIVQGMLLIYFLPFFPYRNLWMHRGRVARVGMLMYVGFVMEVGQPVCPALCYWSVLRWMMRS